MQNNVTWHLQEARDVRLDPATIIINCNSTQTLDYNTQHTETFHFISAIHS